MTVLILLALLAGQDAGTLDDWRGPVVRQAGNQPAPGSSELFLYCSPSADAGSFLHPRDLSVTRRTGWVPARFRDRAVFVRRTRWARQCDRPVANL